LKELAKSGAIDAELAAAFDASPNPYMLLTPDLRYAGMNEAYLEVVGSTREALVGRPVFEVFNAGPSDEAPENVRQLKTSFERVLATGQADHIALIPYAMPVLGAAGEVVYEERFWSATHTPIRDGSGRIAYILQHTTDVTELVNLRRQVAEGQTARAVSALDAIIGGDVLRRARHVQADNIRLEGERNRLVELFMQAPGFIAVLRGPEHVFELANEAYRSLVGGRDVLGKGVKEALPEVENQGFIELLDQVFHTGEPFEGRGVDIRLMNADGRMEEVFLNFIYQPVRNEAGEVVGIFVQGYDVTEQARATERQKLMIDELNHRVKNTLATVQSIAMQTARSHPEPRTFAESFQARLLSLSHTHDLLTRSHWEGAELHEVLEHETEAHGVTRVLLNGPRLSLSPSQALSLGMIFHELATNAAKYGALSAPGGRVLVDWSLGEGPERRLRLTWKEAGGPPPGTPTRRGFGSRLIERNVRHDLSGEVKLSYLPDGLVAEFSIPLDGRDHHD